MAITFPTECLQLRWRLRGRRHLEGEVRKSQLKVDAENRAYLHLGGLPPGYYFLQLSDGRICEQALIVRAPAKAWTPRGYLDGQSRDFGVAIQLYEMIGPQSLGIGDLSDLSGLLREASRIGASAVGVNPLHALSLGSSESISPYSPSSRYALHPLYLDLRSLKGIGEAAGDDGGGDYAFSLLRRGLNESRYIDYDLTSKIKLRLLKQAWRKVASSDLPTGFVKFRKACPYGLEDWAQFEALSQLYGRDFSSWPPGLNSADPGVRRRWAAAHAAQVDFYIWLQWQLQGQLSQAQIIAKRNGMAIGLYRDLAVGADSKGAESWAEQHRVADGLQIGAPPDDLNPAGQNWGFPVMNPWKLSEAHWEPFIQLIRCNMRSAGALRIDHVLGLARLFVIPKDRPASQGTYLSYPLKALTAILVLESHRAKCLVVGEDLGTVSPGLRPWLARRGILSYRLLYFEQDSRGRPRRPADYPRQALSAVGNHDVAPFHGWWREKDLNLLDHLQLWPSQAMAEGARVRRRREKEAMQAEFVRSGLTASVDSVPTEAAYRWLARSESRLLMVQPEDALGIDEPVNVPGTNGDVPNWSRRRLPPWPQWTADPRWCRLAGAVKEERQPVVQSESRSPPTLIYRVQVSQQFPLEAAAKLAGYLGVLGVSDLYLSPVLQSVRHSSHGYDVIDPQIIDADRGGEMGLSRLQDRLMAEGLTFVLDFVPNHMAAHESNPWWCDLLQWGPQSPFSGYFDIDWGAGTGKLILPLLPQHRTPADLGGGLKFAGASLVFQFHGRSFPLALESYGRVLGEAACRCSFADLKHQLRGFVQQFNGLRRLRREDRRSRGIILQAELASGIEKDHRLAQLLDRTLQDLARNPEFINRIVSHQHWRLCEWSKTRINYRRFADIDELVALRVERPEVFAALHWKLLQLSSADTLSGIRLDHIDGLAAPSGYLGWLRGALNLRGCTGRLWVEKVLMKNEELPSWPVSGTTGYEFLNDLTSLLLVRSGVDKLRLLWERIEPRGGDFAHVLRVSKTEVLRSTLRPALERIVAAMTDYAPVERDLLRHSLEAALIDMPVYRLYPDQPEQHASKLTAAMGQSVAIVSPKAARWLTRVLFPPSGTRLPAALRDAAARFWQLSATLMAKGLEDRALYRHHGLLALCEVGGDPRRGAMDTDEFHERMRRRAEKAPKAINTTTTHDTKRSEDSRYRLAMLSVLSEDWSKLCGDLAQICHPMRDTELTPADEYLVWQTLVAVWPVPIGPLEAQPRANLSDRLHRYLIKALREASERSSWRAPNDRYEQKILRYVDALIDPGVGDRFQHVFLPFLERLASQAKDASLIAVTLKFTAPGIPDVYQGCELWNLNLVDPDNRRPVHYGLRMKTMQGLQLAIEGHPEPGQFSDWYQNWADGRIKLYLTGRLARLRRLYPELFSRGAYLPMVDDNGCARLLSFSRRWRHRELIVVVRLPSAIDDDSKPKGMWSRMRSSIPDGVYVDWLQGAELKVSGGLVLSKQTDFPVSVLLREG